MKFPKPALIFFISLVINACAFKEPEKHLVPAAPPPPLAASLSFDFASARDTGAPQSGQRALVEESPHTLKGESPFLLSEKMPDVLKGRILLPSLSLKRPPSIRFKIGIEGKSESVTAEANHVEIDPADPKQLTFEIPLTGEVTALKQEAEIQGELVVLVDALKKEAIRVEFSLLSPPSRVTAEQVPLEPFERGTGPVTEGLKSLRGAQFRADLVQVIKLTSDSSRDVLLTLPFQLYGQVKAHFARHESNKVYCNEAVVRTEFNDLLSSDLFLIPLEESLATQWPAFTDAGYKQGTFQRLLPAGASLILGVFASGIKIQRLVEGAYERPSLQNGPIATSCNLFCGQRKGVFDNSDPAGWGGEPSQYKGTTRVDYWIKQNRRDLVEVCENINCTPTIHPNLIATYRERCRQCALKELAIGLPSTSEYRYCTRPLGGRTDEPWWGEPHYTTVKLGIESLPVKLVIIEQSIEASYPAAKDSESYARRTLRDLLAKESDALN